MIGCMSFLVSDLVDTSATKVMQTVDKLFYYYNIGNQWMVSAI